MTGGASAVTSAGSSVRALTRGLLLASGSGQGDSLLRAWCERTVHLGAGRIQAWAWSPLSYLAALPVHPIELRARIGRCRTVRLSTRRLGPDSASKARDRSESPSRGSCSRRTMVHRSSRTTEMLPCVSPDWTSTREWSRPWSSRPRARSSTASGSPPSAPHSSPSPAPTSVPTASSPSRPPPTPGVSSRSSTPSPRRSSSRTPSAPAPSPRPRSRPTGGLPRPRPAPPRRLPPPRLEARPRDP